LLSLLRSASASSVDITACPAAVPAGGMGVVQADLNCTSGTDSGYVVLGQGATLQLNGHSLTFNPGSTPSALVLCEGTCTVSGPGTLTSSTSTGNFASIWVATGKTAKV